MVDPKEMKALADEYVEESIYGGYNLPGNVTEDQLRAVFTDFYEFVEAVGQDTKKGS